MNRQWLAQRPYVIAVVIAVLLVLWMASGLVKTDEAAVVETEQDVPPPKVKVETLVAEKMFTRVELYGRTEPDRVATIKAQVKGKVVEVLAKRGAQVKKGQIIARLAVNDLEFQLAKARALLSQRELEYDGTQRLNKQGYQGKVQLSQAQAALSSVKADIKQLEIEIEHTVIKAPFDGVMNTRYVEQGDYVKVADNIAMIADLDPIVVRAHITEHQISKIHVGQIASISLLNAQAEQGEIRYIASVADDATNTFKIEVAINNADYQLKAGLSGEVNIALEQTQAIKVSPALLALDEAGNVGVKTVVDGVVHFTGIDIVKTESDGIWLGGLGAQADIITLGQGFVRAGDKVRPINPADKQQ